MRVELEMGGVRVMRRICVKFGGSRVNIEGDDGGCIVGCC